MKSRNRIPFKNYWSIFLLAVAFTGLQACSSDDDPEPVNEEEIITTLRVTLQPASGAPVVLQSQDLDGDGPNAPEITVSGPLQADTQYDGSVEVLNETETPAEDITAEVREEDEEHQFFYEFSGSIAQIDYTDQDGNGDPIGLSFSLTTGAAGNANLTVTLRHEPQKPNDGTLADAGGETDVAQSFSVVVE